MYSISHVAKAKGFTLIELLVVISIIGLLSTLAVVALGSARAKSRDARRVSDVKQIQTALELYRDSTTAQTYPAAPAGNLGEASSGAFCLNSSGWIATTNCAGAYMAQVPSDPAIATYHYTYTRPTTDTYSIAFTLEQGTGGMVAGAHTADQNGMR